MKGYTIQSIQTRSSTLSDGGLSIGFHTKELDSKDKVAIMDMINQSGWLLFKPSEIQESDIPSKDVEIGVKTPSQRLRAVIYKWYMMSEDKENKDFDTFYKQTIERFIDHIKSKLD